jgi:site-specific recombinase XerD
MKAKKPISKKPTLEELIFGALSQLQAMHYNVRSIRRYQSTWNRLIKFAKQNNFEDKLSEKLIIQFLEYYGVKPEELTTKKAGWRKHAEFSLKILWQFSRYGYFERLNVIVQKLNVPLAMKEVLNEYVRYCREKHYISDYCYNERIREVSLFLDFVATKQDIKTFEQIQPQDFSEFIISLWRFSTRTISRTVSDLRQFFKYLFLRDLITRDISKTLPTVHVTQNAKIPSVWDRELVVKLLSAVDRSSPRGKRDYAILLLAYQLGLRVSDIRNLTLDQIDWEVETISFVQSKTQRHLTLPLSNEVGNALIDYIKFGRPKTPYRQVFLRLKLPYVPFSKDTHLDSIVTYWRNLAGIQFKTKQHHGMHSLRHSLATYLLEKDTPFFVISNILGHKSTASTMIYAKSSVEMLRSVALSFKKEVPHVKQS